MISTGEAVGSAWSFLIAGEERQFQGNAGYEDVVQESYSYDSTVGNHRRVALGDLVVIRSGREALGIGYVEQLEIFPNREKLRSRCPGCGSTGFKERTSMRPRFRCSPCGMAFDRPSAETIKVTSYRAHYGGTWQALEGCLERALLSELSLSRSDQQSIKAMDYSGILAAVASRGIRLPRRRPASVDVWSRPFELPGGRRRTTVAVRRGQDAFRRALVRRYGMICAVTGRPLQKFSRLRTSVPSRSRSSTKLSKASSFARTFIASSTADSWRSDPMTSSSRLLRASAATPATANWTAPHYGFRPRS